MSLPLVEIASVADEDALITGIRVLAAAAGWTTWDSSTTPANSVWFRSTGESGDYNIAGGLRNSSGRILAYAAADIDSGGLVAANVSGYVNNDAANTTAIAAKVNSVTNGATQWRLRQAAQNIVYLAAVSRDAISVLVEYPDAALGNPVAQGFIHIGAPIGSAGGALYESARARIAAIDASTPAATLVTLDRNINNALKLSGGGAYSGDTYAQTLLFQSTGTTQVSDFALTQRISFSTLTTSGGNTRFTVDTTTSGKLTGTPGGTNGRYRDGRGVGDIVRLCAEPNIAVAFSTQGATEPGNASNAALTAWDAWGGQAAALDVALGDFTARSISSMDPIEATNTFSTYRLYVMVVDNATTMLAQSDNNGRKTVGALRHVIRTSFGAGQLTNYAFVTLDKKRHMRYRALRVVSGQGLGGPSQSLSDNIQGSWAVGPGW